LTFVAIALKLARGLGGFDLFGTIRANST
jgi:hypothetical protein